ncbi:MAG: HEAT repeat domain-containing protein [Spirochaetes bacterium]|nr:HEAT repeat domain-containing protein [Spirochaetota bacterium]
MRASKVKAAVLSALLLVLPLSTTSLFPQAEPAPSNPQKAEIEKKRRETIAYGIESEIIDLLKVLRSEKDGRYDEQLLALLKATRSRKLLSELFSYFGDVKFPGASEKAVSVVDERDRLQAETVKAALSYLIAVKARNALGEASEIIEAPEKDYVGHAVRIFGAAGGPDEAVRLVAMYDADEWAENVRIEIIRALGDIKAPEAVERLGKLLDDGSTGKVLRMSACDALASIGDQRAKPAILKAAFDDDPNVRTSAVEALYAFQGEDVEAAVVESLRDPFGKTRIAAARTAGKRRLRSAIPNLEYKAASDPERAVREASLKAIAEIGGGESFDFLGAFLSDKKNDTAFRALAFGLLVRNDSSSASLLRETLESAISEKDQTFFKAVAREIVAIDVDAAVPYVERLLSHPDFTIRLGALEWIRRTGNRALLDRVNALSESDPSEVVRKRAAQLKADIVE